MTSDANGGALAHIPRLLAALPAKIDDLVTLQAGRMPAANDYAWLAAGQSYRGAGGPLVKHVGNGQVTITP